MNGPDLVEAAKARLDAEVPGWTTYANGVPDGNLPGRYRVLRASEGWEEATRACGRTSVQAPSLWVTSVVRHPNGQFAASQVAQDAAAVRAALRDWRPEGKWKLAPAGSQPAGRNEALPDTNAYTVEQFTYRSTI